MYRLTAEALKAFDPMLKVGGPCTSSIDNIEYTEGFLSYVRDHDVPLDFFSWHRYTTSPFTLYQDTIFVRNLLNSYGFYEAENINTEWNFDILAPQRDKDNGKNAAFTACCLSAFHDAHLDHAFRYRGTQDPNWFARFIGFDLSLFSYDGMFKTPALSFLMFHLMEAETPIRLETPSVTAENDVAYIAGISQDSSNISVLISNYDAGEINYSISFHDLPWDSSYHIVTYCVDDENHFEIIDQKMMNSSELLLSSSLKESTIHFYRVTNTSRFPDEGPDTAEIPWFLQLKLFDKLGQVLGILLFLLFFD
jgi:hypothetical protein